MSSLPASKADLKSSHTQIRQAESTFCREGQDSYWANRVDDVLGTHELEARARHITAFSGGKEQTHREDTSSLGSISAPFSRPVFPQEIFDIIITYLSEYPRVLIRLILVCKKWTPLCRRLLYSSLDFGLGDDFDKKCLYPHHVRRMSLVSSYGHHNLDWIQPIARSLDKFTSLDHLELVDFPWDGLWLDSGTGLLNAPVMRQVTKAFFGGVEVETLDDVALSISQGLPGLKELVVLMEVFEDEESEPSDSDSDSDSPVPLPVPQELSQLTILDHPLFPTPTRFWWRWLTDMKFTGLRSVTLGELLSEDWALFKAFVDVAGQSLSDLGIGIGSVGDLNTFTSRRILASCPNLESLKITQPIRVMNEEWGCEESVDGLCRLFSSFTARRLRVVSLPVVRRWAVEVERGVRAEGALTAERFPVLEALEFPSDHDSDTDPLTWLSTGEFDVDEVYN
ncbi:hypothetical protein L218DRAFT_999119 [Marasmius fiardii PR-910]|nr:hypothetical protein L218DRAFT_999119 [Marasmius fiardii PR-910]